MTKQKSTNTFDLFDDNTLGAKIMVVGVGGGGSNSVQRMVERNLEGAELVCANTDVQHLGIMTAPNLIRLGERLTKGLGAGGDPQCGYDAALENENEIADLIDGTDLLFLTAGMGGGTGTGALPVFARIANEKDILCVSVVTTPFHQEGKKRLNTADEGIHELYKYVDSVIIISNQKLMEMHDAPPSMRQRFNKADEVLYGAVKGITDLIINPGEMNLDFADVRRVMGKGGRALMGSGVASGDDRAKEAARLAIHNPLLDEPDCKDATAMLISITSSSVENSQITTEEFETVVNMMDELVLDNNELQKIIGTAYDDSLEDNLRVSVVAAGFQKQGQKKKPEQTSNNILHIDNAQNNRRGLSIGKKNNESENPVPQDYDKYGLPPFLRDQND